MRELLDDDCKQSYHKRLTAFYLRFNKRKANAYNVSYVLKKYRTHEVELFNRLTRKYSKQVAIALAAEAEAAAAAPPPPPAPPATANDGENNKAAAAADGDGFRTGLDALADELLGKENSAPPVPAGKGKRASLAAFDAAAKGSAVAGFPPCGMDAAFGREQPLPDLGAGDGADLLADALHATLKIEDDENRENTPPPSPVNAGENAAPAAATPPPAASRARASSPVTAALPLVALGTAGPGEALVLTHGSGDCGQLGHGAGGASRTEVARPRRVAALAALAADPAARVAALACGGMHNAALGADGRVWTWGLI